MTFYCQKSNRGLSSLPASSWLRSPVDWPPRDCDQLQTYQYGTVPYLKAKIVTVICVGQRWKVTRRRTVLVPRFSTRHRSTARSPRLALTLRGVGWNTGTNWPPPSMTSSATDHCPVSTSPLLTSTSVATHIHTDTETHRQTQRDSGVRQGCQTADGAAGWREKYHLKHMLND